MLLFFFFFGSWRRLRRETLRAAIQPSVGHFHGHEHQVFVDRHIALPAGADHRGHQRGVCRIADVKNIHAVEISLEQVVALEGEVGVGEGQLRNHQLQRLGHFGDIPDAQLLTVFSTLGLLGSSVPS